MVYSLQTPVQSLQEAIMTWRVVVLTILLTAPLTPLGSVRAADADAQSEIPSAALPEETNLPPDELREKIRVDGIRKAKELGYRPVILARDEEGTSVCLQGSQVTRVNNTPLFVDGDLVVNAGKTDEIILGAKLARGEFGVVRDGKCTMLPGILGGLRLSFSDESAKGDPESAEGFDRLPEGWPKTSGSLAGEMEVRVRNPNHTSVRVAVRSGGMGNDFVVSPQGVHSTFVPNGRYQIYFQYSYDPKGLYQGDEITLNNRGVEIQSVDSPKGNYRVRKVR